QALGGQFVVEIDVPAGPRALALSRVFVSVEGRDCVNRAAAREDTCRQQSFVSDLGGPVCADAYGFEPGSSAALRQMIASVYRAIPINFFFKEKLPSSHTDLQRALAASRWSRSIRQPD
ncbi:MAG TPA: hypothetical protein VNT79_08865, partial [Phycisphaerae bacterium]|nr:hypothetical protein [Phycisphaerae bacterium]